MEWKEILTLTLTLMKLADSGFHPIYSTIPAHMYVID